MSATLATPPPPPAANGEPPPQPTTSDNLPALAPDELRIALAAHAHTSTTAPFALAAELEIEPHALLATLRRPHVQAWLRAAAELEDFRIELLARRAKADALEALAELARDKAAEPVERRRAASAILRALRPPPAPRAAPDPDSCEKRRGSFWDRWSAARARSGAAVPHPAATPASDGPDARADATTDQQANDHAGRDAEVKPDDPDLIEDEIEDDRSALRRRFDFTTRDAAANSVARIFTGVDPEDPEAALYAIFLATEQDHNLGDFDIFLAHTTYLRPASRAQRADIKYVRDVGRWHNYRLTLHLPAGDPLDFSLWLYSEKPKVARSKWEITVIRPWLQDEPAQPVPYIHGNGYDFANPLPRKPP